METINSIIIQLLDLINNKKQQFDSIMEITLQQKKDIEENEAKRIEEFLDQKQTVINSVDEIDKAFSERFGLLKKQLNVNTLEEVDIAKYPMMKILKFKVEEIMSLAKKIMQIEESNKEKLTLMMIELKTEMKKLNVGKKSIKAYESPIINNDGIYIDRKK